MPKSNKRSRKKIKRRNKKTMRGGDPDDYVPRWMSTTPLKAYETINSDIVQTQTIEEQEAENEAENDKHEQIRSKRHYSVTSEDHDGNRRVSVSSENPDSHQPKSNNKILWGGASVLGVGAITVVALITTGVIKIH